LKILFISSGNNSLDCPIAVNQANSIQKHQAHVQIEHYRVIGKGFFGYLKNLKPLTTKIRSFDPDIIHSHYSFCGYLAVLAFSKKPIVASLMGSDVQLNGFWKLTLKLFSKFWDTVIVKSQDMKDKCSIKKAIVIPNGVDFENYEFVSKNEARRILGLDNNKIYVTFLADPSRPEKNYKLAISSFKKIKEDNKELLTVYNISHEKTRFYYYASDVIIMSSKYEGSPNVIKEAMACNKPIVSTSVGDVDNLLIGVNGCYISRSDPNSMAQDLEKAINFKEDTRGRQRLLELGIDAKSISTKIVSLYKQLSAKESIEASPINSSAVIKVCAKGIWDETVPGAVFDEMGISNYCKLQEKMMRDYPRGETGKQQWAKLVSEIKKEGKNKTYDCIIGVSGGVDSSNLLRIAIESGLIPLAVHLDNGFDSEIAVGNIQKVTEKLRIDLESYVINYDEIKDLLKSYMKAGLPWIDAPTDLAIKAAMYKVALKKNIKYVIRGNDFRSEGKQPTLWTYSDTKQLKFIHHKFGSKINLNSYPSISLAKMVYIGLFKKVKDIRPYYYLDYNKAETKEKLIKEFGWRDYGGHHHENLFTKFVMSYWLPHKFKIDKRKINLSAQILSGAITRDEALAQLKEPFDTQKNMEEIRTYVIKKLGMNDEEFNAIFKQTNRNFKSYPSNYDLVYKNIRHFKWVIKSLYGFKPMSIDSSEMID
jgi:N-acetyl sugar amidotransferase